MRVRLCACDPPNRASFSLSFSLSFSRLLAILIDDTLGFGLTDVLLLPLALPPEPDALAETAFLNPTAPELEDEDEAGSGGGTTTNVGLPSLSTPALDDRYDPADVDAGRELATYLPPSSSPTRYPNSDTCPGPGVWLFLPSPGTLPRLEDEDATEAEADGAEVDEDARAFEDAETEAEAEAEYVRLSGPGRGPFEDAKNAIWIE